MRVIGLSRLSTGSSEQSAQRRGLARWVIGLALAILVSAFMIVYFKDLNRRVFINYQSLKQQTQYYQVQWGKLMLEESAWSTQARIQSIAQTKLGMIMPLSKKIVMIALDNPPAQASPPHNMLAENSPALLRD